jgi:rRNA maturation endonuclease Nob1
MQEVGVTDRTAKPHDKIVVIDTSVFFVSPQPWDAPQLSAVEGATYVIPATVLFELDRVMERAERRDRARAALNALKPLVDRGATQGAISCGRNASLRIASNSEEIAHTGLNLELGDDRILALAVKLKDEGREVALATTEFALYAKAVTVGLAGILVSTPEPIPTRTPVSRKEKELFWASWQKVNDARSPVEVSQRAYQFLRQRLVQRLLADAAQTGQPEPPLLAYQKFQRLEGSGGGNAALSVMGLFFGVGPPPNVNSSTALVIEYNDSWSTPRTRSESAPERALRLQREQAAVAEYETRVLEAIRESVQTVRDYIMGQLGDDLG